MGKSNTKGTKDSAGSSSSSISTAIKKKKQRAAKKQIVVKQKSKAQNNSSKSSNSRNNSFSILASSLFGPIRKQRGPSTSNVNNDNHNNHQSQRAAVKTTIAQRKAQPPLYPTKHSIMAIMRPTSTTKKRPRPRPTISLPSRHTIRKLMNVVWWTGEDNHPISNYDQNDSRNNNTTTRQRTYKLPTDDLPPQMMTLLDQELEAFSEYVKLTEDEIAARHHILQHVTDIAGNLFPKGPIQVECFGSFATLPVATFASDVDMALWGVVPPPTPQYHDHHHPPHQTCHELTPKQEPLAKQRESRIHKWREALSELDQMQKEKEELASAKKQQLQDSTPPAKALLDTTTKVVSIDHEEIPVEPENARGTTGTRKTKTRSDSLSNLFVLDRVGAVELGANENDLRDLFSLDRDPGPEEKEKKQDEGTEGNPVILNDQEANVTLDLCSDSDDDSADKLEALSDRTRSAHRGVTESPPSSDDDSEDEDEDECEPSDSLEVSFISNAPTTTISCTRAPEMDVETRRQVVHALRALCKALWRSPVMSKIEVRHRAKVPIVTTETKLGFEADVAVGGHNGTDTSKFAATQVKKYKSFSPVVLILKVLLAQQDLDKPFTGGLGSFKLYVLVSHHLERHLSLGGSDRPSEVLMSFFGRFGNARKTPMNCHQHCFTWLGTDAPDVSCQDGSADLKAVFKIDNCVDLFGAAWDSLMETIACGDLRRSLLADVVDEVRLRRERESRLDQAKLLRNFTQTRKTHSWIPLSAGPKNAAASIARRVNHVFERARSKPPEPMPPPRSSIPTVSATALRPKRDATEQELLDGYGVQQRSIRGALLPKFRPDLEARKTQDAVLGRATKNRHSKKKQQRDAAMKEFATKRMKVK